MQQEKNLETVVKNYDKSLKLINIEEQHERVDVTRNLYMPESILEQHLKKKLYKNAPIPEMKNEFKFLYNTDNNKITDMIIISTHNYDILDKNNLSENDKRLKSKIKNFQNIIDIDLTFFRGRYKMTVIPAELRHSGNWFSLSAKNEPYMTIEMVRNYVM